MPRKRITPARKIEEDRKKPVRSTVKYQKELYLAKAAKKFALLQKKKKIAEAAKNKLKELSRSKPVHPKITLAEYHAQRKSRARRKPKK